MPLTGLHCPGTPWIGAELDDCKKCNSPCLPIELIKLVRKHTVDAKPHYHDDPKVISVTEAIGCLRKAYYGKMLPYTEDPVRLFPRVHGTIIHEAIEAAQDDDCSEVALGMPIGHGYRLQGTADRMRLRLKDWKTVDRPRKTYHDTEALQLSCYAKMSKRDPLPEMQIVQVHRRGATVHDVTLVENALDVVVERAGRLIDALLAKCPEGLEKEGPGIRFFKVCACDSCPHKEICMPEVDND